MKPIAILTGDWHVHRWKEFSKKDSRLKATLDLLRKFSIIASTHNIPILFTGDLFHDGENLKNKVFEMFVYYFKKYMEKQNVKFCAISGNHDMSEINDKNNTSPSYIKSLSKIFPNIICLDNTYEAFVDFRVIGIPYYTKNYGFKTALREAKKNINPKKKNILMIHRDLPGAMTPEGIEIHESNDISSLDKIFKGFDLVIAGHIHKPAKLNGFVYMLGAPQQQNRGDCGCDMGYWMLYEDFSLKFFPLSEYPQFLYIDEGIPLPDEYNYYIIRPKITKDDDSDIPDFDVTTDRKLLAKRYCRTIKEKDKRRINLLVELLNKDE